MPAGFAHGFVDDSITTRSSVSHQTVIVIHRMLLSVLRHAPLVILDSSVRTAVARSYPLRFCK
jgi:hypothetical protein